MRRLFVVSTFLHMINTINLIENNLSKVESENVLFILNNNDSYKEILDLAEFSNLFSEIYILDINKYLNAFNSSIKKIKGYIFYKTIAKDILKNCKNHFYDEFYFSFMDFPMWLIFLYLKKLNRNIKLYSISDGIGGYNLLTTKENKINKIVLHFFGFNTLFEELKKLYIYNKDLVNNYYYPHVKIENLPKIDKNNKLFFLLKTYNKKKNFVFDLKYKFIFFESPFNNEELNKKQMYSIKFINKISNNFCIKKHPRRSIKLDLNFKECNIKKNIAMECIYVEDKNNIENKVFISGISAAAILAKLIFDKEPYVIFLYKLWDMDKVTYNDDNYIKFLNKFKNIYSKKEKIFIPESYEELEKNIRFLDDKVIVE